MSECLHGSLCTIEEFIKWVCCLYVCIYLRGYKTIGRAFSPTHNHADVGQKIEIVQHFPHVVVSLDDEWPGVVAMVKSCAPSLSKKYPLHSRIDTSR